MSVGKESLERAAKTTTVKKSTSARTKTDNSRTVAAASVISGSDIHEKKFEAVSGIKCDLPTYLL